ncbi:MAG: translation elongation factor Ts [Candidatus Marinimicrobia bacterium]|nr:translation elongation factor Ts [Candidatus Neomarinimicrobiota bacterium]
MISAALVKQLREKTGAGLMDCKRALQKADGDLEKAVDHLRTAGIAKADKKAGRQVADGLVFSYIHPGAKLGVLLEVNCETDFVAKTDNFQQFVRDVAMHIAATDPRVIRREDLPPEEVEREQGILVEQARQSGKPEQILDKIVLGRLEKFFAENALLEQPFVKDPQKTIEGYLKETISTLGENIVITRFVRFQLGQNEVPGSSQS